MSEEDLLNEALLEFDRFVYGKQLSKDDLVEYVIIIISAYKKEKEKNKHLEDKIKEMIDRMDLEEVPENIKYHNRNLKGV